MKKKLMAFFLYSFFGPFGVLYFIYHVLKYPEDFE